MAGAPENPFPVVGVGASAGGLAALTQLLEGLPAKPGCAIVIIQHLDPRYESHLPELLAKHTRLKINDAEHGSKVKPNHIYVIRPNTSVAIADGVLSVTARPDERQPHYPVDHFFRSLAAVQAGLGVGVVLSGTGADGTLGLVEIKAAGGLTFAQDEASAQHPGMPASAIRSGAVDLVLTPEEIGARLGTLPRARIAGDAAVDDREDEDAFRRVILALRQTSGVDFSQYRDTTIKRRTGRRMMLRGFKSAAEYALFVERDREEADALYRDVLINVTSFFRDPQMFEDLKRDVLPRLIAGVHEDRAIRVWVPGCSTGQEAYSIAMVLLEYLDEAKIHRVVQIFATDLGDPVSLDKARTGLYPESIEAEVSPERLRRFFVKEDSHYRIHKTVRDLCVFARQNVTVDPPFSRVDLITCRNVMIYMSPPLQARLLPVFHFALNPGGFLILGVAETVGSFEDLFELVNGPSKVYRKKETSRRPPLTFMADEWLGTTPRRAAAINLPPQDFQRDADRALATRYAPPSVLVNHDFEVQHFRGRTAPFLEAPTGQPTTNILRLAKEGLFMELRSALNEAKATMAPVERPGLRVLETGSDIEFTLRILPVSTVGTGDCCFLVLFETKAWPVWTPPAEPVTSSTREAVALRQELAATKQYLQSLVDQHDSSEQELRAAHEEVLSSNEELQSTNEELETTKEELQSANEELTTVNEQFQTRNRELDALTDDLSNFISSTDLPMATVGRDLCIRRVTPAAQRTFNLLPTDVGRSIEHIKFSLALDDIGGVITEVIDTVHPWEREVIDRSGRWWLVRVRPFRTADNRIDGATIVALDVDVIKRSHELVEARDYVIAIIQTVREPLVVLDSECRVGFANDAFYQLFGQKREDLEGRTLWGGASVNWVDEPLRRALIDAAGGRGSVSDLEIERVLPSIGLRSLMLNAQGIVRDGHPALTLLCVDDITDSKRSESLRVDAEALRQVDRRKDEFLGILAHELRNPLAPMRLALELMKNPDNSAADAARVRQVLERQVSHMVRIVDDLLDVSRITQGKVELRKEWLRLETIVSSAVEVCRPAVDAARHTLVVSLPDEPVWIDADPVRVTQVVVNLLNNAVKFTPAGQHIWLIAETTGDNLEKPDTLRIRVRDTGIGIAPELLPFVFDMFTQGDRSLERTRAGLGVGLTLVRHLVALHGGQVEARSEGTGSGSEFIVTLPLNPDAQPGDRTVASAKQEPARPLRILVADDNDDGREMLVKLLTAEGHYVTAASDGPEAVAAAEASRPEVAILDIGMPHLNGYDVARRLRELFGQESPKLIALSGLGQKEDKARSADAGFDRHFTKPVDISAMRALLAEVAASQPPKRR